MFKIDILLQITILAEYEYTHVKIIILLHNLVADNLSKDWHLYSVFMLNGDNMGTFINRGARYQLIHIFQTYVLNYLIFINDDTLQCSNKLCTIIMSMML